MQSQILVNSLKMKMYDRRSKAIRQKPTANQLQNSIHYYTKLS